MITTGWVILVTVVLKLSDPSSSERSIELEDSRPLKRAALSSEVICLRTSGKSLRKGRSGVVVVVVTKR